jgi:hypothetical protein
MTTGVIIFVTFLVFIMLGYRFNRDTSTIQQGGLVQFASRPSEVNVKIGNASLTDLTPSKITVNPGSYTVTMNRKNYKTWTKNVDVRAGEVLWLNYAQMTPNTIKTDTVGSYVALSQVKASPNGDRFAMITDPSKPVVTFVDVTGDKPKSTTITIPAELLPTDTTPTFALADWASDSDRLLVNMTYNGMTERIVVDRREVKRTVNISKSYESDISEAIFDPRSSERLIVRTSKGDVRSIDTAGDSLSTVIASSVTFMSLYGSDALLLVQSVAEGGQSVGYVSLGSKEVRELRKVQSVEPTRLAIGKYFSEPYVAISTGNKLEVLRVKSLPSSDSDASISMTSVYAATLPASVDYLAVRSGGRFVMAQYGSGVQTYDIELARQTLTSFKAPVAGELRWLDKYHFYVTNGTTLEVMEFDGGNAQAITALTTDFDAVQSDDGKFIYSVTKTDAGYELQRSRMILE